MFAEPHEVHPAWAAAFNDKDVDAIAAMFHDDGVFVPQPGSPVTGEGIRTATEQFLAMGLPIDLTVRHVYVAGDTAIVVGDWTISGTAADGNQVDLSGSVADVLRRDADGWKFAIDNPFGTA